jgi:hypothetical protein
MNVTGLLIYATDSESCLSYTLENAGEGSAKIHIDATISERLHGRIISCPCHILCSPAALAICVRYRTTTHSLKPKTVGSIALPPDPSVHCAFHKTPMHTAGTHLKPRCVSVHLQPRHPSCFFVQHIGQIKQPQFLMGIIARLGCPCHRHYIDTAYSQFSGCAN